MNPDELIFIVELKFSHVMLSFGELFATISTKLHIHVKLGNNEKLKQTISNAKGISSSNKTNHLNI